MNWGLTRFFAGLALFVLAPLLLLEASARLGHRNLFQRLEAELAQGPVQLIAMGSSRVAAAVDGELLAAELSKAYGRPLKVSNLGRGYSKPQDKFLAFREWLDRYPGSLQGSWLLIEAPAGVPDPATWKGPWAQFEEPGLISTYLHFDDWRRMAFESATPLPLVFEAGLYRVSRGALALRKIRDALSVTIQNWRPGFLAEKGAELGTGGGVLAGANAVRLAKARARFVRGEAQGFPEWKDTVWQSLAELARARGMKVAFFEPPMSAPDAKATLDGLPAEARSKRAAELAAQGVQILRTGSSFPDSAFPDLLHLGPASTPEYTRALSFSFNRAFPYAF